MSSDAVSEHPTIIESNTNVRESIVIVRGFTKTLGVALLVLSSVENSFAGPIYSVDRSIGVGSVSGTIETDGTFGILGTSNIIDWNLTLDNGVDTFTLAGSSNSERIIVGSSLSATVSDILFDFGGNTGGFAFQHPGLGSGINFWALDDQSGSLTGNAGVETVRLLSSLTTSPSSAVAAVASIAHTPEPASITLTGGIGAGMLGFGWLRRRRK